ncbi:MAG: hypothetical protein WAU86_06315 [Oricola sp.]
MPLESTAYLAIDVETANSDPASICQIGLALFRDGELAQTWRRLVDSGQTFDALNTSMHGIAERDMRKAVPLKAVLEPLLRLTAGKIVASHTNFEQVALDLAAEAASLPPFGARWLDVSMVARRTWPEVAQRGCELANLCAMIGIEAGKPNDALEAAVASGKVLAAACKQSGHGPRQWHDMLGRNRIAATGLTGTG